MAESKLVRVSPDTMAKLAKARNGFESPNDCMNRLLSQNPCKSEKKESDEESDIEEQAIESKTGDVEQLISLDFFSYDSFPYPPAPMPPVPAPAWWDSSEEDEDDF